MNPHPVLSLPPVLETALLSLLARHRPDGGFAEHGRGDSRPDATAWAIICLDSFEIHQEIVAKARIWLASSQLPDGSIPVAPDYPEAFWPTAAAAMALRSDSFCSAAHDKAVDFLLTTTGYHSPKDPETPIGHDSSIPGWPWIEQTHSWIEPTALAIRALVLAGKSAHERVQSGVRLLLDRQLATGGWNYGNTTVLGKALNPMPVSTGMALWALSGLTERGNITTSLTLLAQYLPDLHTPMSLGWVLQGLSAWNVDIQGTDSLLTDCLQRQGRHGTYATSHLAILLMAATASGRKGASHA